MRWRIYRNLISFLIFLYMLHMCAVFKRTLTRGFSQTFHSFMFIKASWESWNPFLEWIVFFPPSGHFDLLGYALSIRAKTSGNKELRVFNYLSLKFTILGTRYYWDFKEEKGLIWDLQSLAAFCPRGCRTKGYKPQQSHANARFYLNLLADKWASRQQFWLGDQEKGLNMLILFLASNNN